VEVRVLFGNWLNSGAKSGLKTSFVRSLLAVAVVLPAAALLMPSFGAAAASKDVAAKAAETSVGTPLRLRLLTTQQYVNTIQYFFGPDIKIDVKFAPLARTDGLLLAGSSLAGVSGAQVEIYQKVASVVATQVLSPERRETLLPCKPKSDKAADNACASKFLGDVARYLYRAPLSKERLAQLVEEAGQTADQLQDFYAGLQVTLEGVLISPNVLFVAETEETNPKTGKKQLDAVSYATRLSLFLWNAAPDAALREAAIKGQLDTEKGRAKFVDAMLASPRLETGARAFFDDMFAFDDFDTISKDAVAYPYFISDAVGDAREQTLRTVIDQLLTKNNDYRDIYTTRETFVSPSLALIYGVPTTPGWRPIEFPVEAHRAGILTHVSFLALHSHPGRSSATLRGKALRELLLCQKVPPPPANVDFSLVENPDPSMKTARDRLDAHRQNPVCAGCHKITDPMGLALENFDGAGQFRLDEKGAPIDASGSLDGKNFANVDGLGVALRNNASLPSCLVRRTLTYATGGALPVASEPALRGLNKSFADQGYRFRALLKAVALSGAFSEVLDVPPAPEKSASAPAAHTVAANSTK
jgi:hypothetical protein